MARAIGNLTPDAPTLRHIIRDLGVVGVAMIAWTGVTCCALIGGDARVIAQVWPDVFWTWVTLAGAYTGFVALGLIGRLRGLTGELTFAPRPDGRPVRAVAEDELLFSEEADAEVPSKPQ